MIHTVYLDMDGVLTNFMDHALALHGTTAKALEPRWTTGSYGVHESLGITEDQFWERIDAREDFWDQLPLYPWADRIFTVAQQVAEHVIILSAPSQDWRSAAGKMSCLQRWKGRHFRDWIFTPAKHKHRLARPDALLVDDSDRNCEDFVEAGGTAIIFPQRWNSNHSLAGETAAPGFVEFHLRRNSVEKEIR